MNEWLLRIEYENGSTMTSPGLEPLAVMQELAKEFMAQRPRVRSIVIERLPRQPPSE